MYLECDFRGVWRDIGVPLVLHYIDLIYWSHLLLLCLLTHLQRSSIRCRCTGVSVAASLHKGLSWSMQELAVLSLLLLMRTLAIYANEPMVREGISYVSLLLRSLPVRLRGLARLEKQISKRKRRRRKKPPELCRKPDFLWTGPGPRSGCCLCVKE